MVFGGFGAGVALAPSSDNCRLFCCKVRQDDRFGELRQVEQLPSSKTRMNQNPVSKSPLDALSTGIAQVGARHAMTVLGKGEHA